MPNNERIEMSREAFEAWVKLDSTLSIERAAERAREFLTHGRSPLGLSVAEAIRVLAKEAKQ
jgi:Mg-chelatase subunit ChlD